MLSNGGHYIIWHQAKQCTVIREIPQISHGFAACLIPQNGWHAMIPVKLWPWHPSPLSPLSLKTSSCDSPEVFVFPFDAKGWCSLPSSKISRNMEKKNYNTTKNGESEKKSERSVHQQKKNRHAKFLSPRWCHFSDSIIFVGIQWYTGHKQQVTNDWSKE